VAPFGVIHSPSRSSNCSWIFKTAVSVSRQNLTFSGVIFGLPSSSTLKKLHYFDSRLFSSVRAWRARFRLCLLRFRPLAHRSLETRHEFPRQLGYPQEEKAKGEFNGEYDRACS
jgi:hypothetical protein